MAKPAPPGGKFIEHLAPVGPFRLRRLRSRPCHDPVGRGPSLGALRDHERRFPGGPGGRTWKISGVRPRHLVIWRGPGPGAWALYFGSGLGGGGAPGESWPDSDRLRIILTSAFSSSGCWARCFCKASSVVSPGCTMIMGIPLPFRPPSRRSTLPLRFPTSPLLF